MSIDLTTHIGNLELRSPIIVGSCPMTTDEIQRISMISNGAGAIVLPSLQVGSQESINNYLEQLKQITKQKGVPVFASVRTGIKKKDCIELTSKLEESGASAIELSIIGCNSSVVDPRKFEDDLVELTEQVDQAIDIPLILKLTRNFTSISALAERLCPYVQGIVMFGRSPVIDIELDNISISRHWGLTQPGLVVTSLEPIMRTRTAFQGMPLIACGGIGSSEDLIKAILAGANAAMVTSVLYRNGTAAIGILRDGLIRFMSDQGVSNIADLQALCPELNDSDNSLSSYYDTSDHAQTVEKLSQDTAIKCDRFGHPVEETF